MNTTTEPRIYVACLSCYNAGHLVGAWMDATDAEAFDIATLEHAKDASPCEEHAIHDYEGFGAIKLDEHESLADVAKLAELLEEHGEAFAAWYDNETRDLSEDLAEQFQEQYRGTWKSLEDYASEFAEDYGLLKDVPEELKYYFDFEAYGRDMESNGSLWTTEGGDGVYVFYNV